MTHHTDEMKIFVRQHFSNGIFITVPCTIGTLGDRDNDAALKLHNDTAHGLSRDLFAPSTEEEIRRFLGNEGLSVGVRHKERLICLRTVKTGREWVKNSLSELGITCNTEGREAITGFCVVDKGFRGNNIQFLSQYYAESILARDFDSITTTVSPKNIFSLQNVLACGYCIIGIKSVYNGYLRYVLRKDFYPDYSVQTHGHMLIPIRKIPEQKCAIEAGYAGYAIIRRAGGFHILYGKQQPKADV